MAPLFFLAFLAFIGFLLYQRRRTYPDITVAPAEKRRDDLLYGYYGCADNQVAETKDHVNLLHESQFDGPEKCIQNILDAQMFTVLDVSTQVFFEGHVKPTAEGELLAFLSVLSLRGALKYIEVIYPIDEPNNTTNALDLSKAVSIIQRVAKSFPDLDGVLLGVCYAEDKPFICQELFDLVGFDAYGKKSSVLTGKYQTFRNTLLPFQKTILFPGAAYGQDPKPFVNWAETDPRVKILMPFLWLDERIDPKTGKGSVGAPGVRSGPLKQQYIDAGKYVTGKS
jgi:hypothetical protein